MRAWCVVVPVERGEEMRRALRDRGLLLKLLKVARDGDRLYVPTIRQVDGDFPVTQRDFEEAFLAIPSYKELVRVPSDLETQLPSSFDIVGDIAIVKIPQPLLPYRRAIGDAFLAWSRKVRVVAQDHGVEGPLRVRRLEILSGEARTTTVHREHGLRYRVDVARAYFSPRLGTERKRIADLVRPGEVVVDPFAGVGPYAILIARRRSPATVLASDVNPVAVRFLRENVLANRADRVVVSQAEAGAALGAASRADRILLDLPHSSRTFLPSAVRALAPGGTVHVYVILERGQVEDADAGIRRAVAAEGRTVETIRRHVVRAYGPTMDHLAFDVTVGPG